AGDLRLERRIEDPVVGIARRDHGRRPPLGLEIAHELEGPLAAAATERREEVGDREEPLHDAARAGEAPASSRSCRSIRSTVSERFPRSRATFAARSDIASPEATSRATSAS